jgi:hypothetical protein
MHYSSWHPSIWREKIFYTSTMSKEEGAKGPPPPKTTIVGSRRRRAPVSDLFGRGHRGCHLLSLGASLLHQHNHQAFGPHGHV